MTPQNWAKIDEAIHQQVGEPSQYEKCSAGWVAKGKKVRTDEEEKKKLIEALKANLK